MELLTYLAARQDAGDIEWTTDHLVGGIAILVVVLVAAALAARKGK